MGDVKRWTVTYTKHVKQKRKVYQDGILHLLSNSKVMLYDETEQLLDSRFLTKDEAVKAGESLAFPSFLVDIGDPECNPNAISHPKVKTENENTTPEKNRLPQGQKFRSSFVLNSKGLGKPNSMRRKASAINLSPSQKIIREFKKNEVQKYSVHQSPTSTVTSSYKGWYNEWEASYTTQITQKAKKYHDGFIRVVICGSYGRQVMLYDSSKNQLDKRFLKKDEAISSGQSLTFDAYLVDVGNPMVTKENDTDIMADEQKCKTNGKGDTLTGRQWQKSLDYSASDSHRRKVPDKQDHQRACNFVVIGQSQQHAGSGKCVASNSFGLVVNQMNLGKRDPSYMPIRDASQILSVLKKPVAMEKTPIVQEAVEKCFSQSSELVQLDSPGEEVQGSLSVDPHPPRRVAQKHKDEKAGNEGYYRTSGECSSSHHHDTSKMVANANSSSPKIEIPISTRGTQVAKSRSPKKNRPADIGSAFFKRLKASIKQGRSVISQTSLVADSMGDISGASSAAGTHSHQPHTAVLETDPTIKAAADSTLDMPKPKCSAEDPLKAKKSIDDFDCPSFDLGF